LAVFIKFKNEILRPYGLRMTKKLPMVSFCSRRRISAFFVFFTIKKALKEEILHFVQDDKEGKMSF
jgi:hypothetical protein